MNRLIIIGASGHGKVIADIAEKNGYTDIVFLDDDPSLHSPEEYGYCYTKVMILIKCQKERLHLLFFDYC